MVSLPEPLGLLHSIFAIDLPQPFKASVSSDTDETTVTQQSSSFSLNCAIAEPPNVWKFYINDCIWKASNDGLSEK